MKTYVWSLDKEGRIDGVVQSHILSRIPQCNAAQDADVVIVPFTLQIDLCKERLSKLAGFGKKWVMLDFGEYGAGCKNITHTWNEPWENASVLFFGNNTEHWAKHLHDFFKIYPPTLVFKRELFKDCHKTNYLPIEYLYQEELEHHEQSLDVYSKRVIDKLMVWGLSHMSRPKLHANMMIACIEENKELAMQPNQIDWCLEKRLKCDGLLYQPYWDRLPLRRILRWQEQAFFSFSLAGEGHKCFRHAEACFGSVMAMDTQSNLKWTYEWKDGVNCVNALNLVWTKKKYDIEQLHKIYLAGQETFKKYQADAYVRDYVLVKIKEKL